ncbi:hypothetical protein D3C87_1581040 [compost metagenome]
MLFDFQKVIPSLQYACRPQQLDLNTFGKSPTVDPHHHKYPNDRHLLKSQWQYWDVMSKKNDHIHQLQLLQHHYYHITHWYRN